MATISWTLGGATSNWSTGTNWSSTPNAPVANDLVFLNNTTKGGAYTVTLDASQPASGSYGALTVGNAVATLALSAASKTLSITGLTTLSAGNINISGTSTLSTGTFLLNGGTFA
jgi:hypothetical protein